MRRSLAGLRRRRPWRAAAALSMEAQHVFDRAVKRRHRDYAAEVAGRGGAAALQMNALKDESARQLLDRLEDIQRDFPLTLDLGCGLGHIRKALLEVPGAGGIEHLVEVDASAGMVEYCRREAAAEANPNSEDEDEGAIELRHAVVDEEFLPFQDNSFDLVLSSMSMHWVNDLPGMLTQARRCLRPDGAFLGAMLGGATLDELRVSLMLAEEELEGGISPHTSPMVQLSDAASLITSAGFRLPVVDSDTYALHYPDMDTLMRELQRAGDGNAVPHRRHHVPRRTFARAAEIYRERFGEEDGSLPATFQIIYMIGWKEHESQQQPKARGSANASMKDALEVEVTVTEGGDGGGESKA
uniref:Methyltransferase type 11 domain-containing protein n=1 Tax=Phaeomonas parva TaxID=124430 RepID=A0A7S1U990_9STRA|mmetsp:Transcript_34669/g.108908  ORF Transcript_34669/g.108908 Transcript_34669/m.108908 type:complete len:356 (+) Transcript_34669:119-1186(+)